MDPSNNIIDQDDHEEAGELLEQGWFFGNLLQTNSKSSSRMLRSFSDPCTSSNFPPKSYEETYKTITKGKSKPSLVRAPSLPTTLDEEELEFSMGKLIRQASLNTRPPPPPPKNFTAIPTLTRHRSMRLKSSEVDDHVHVESPSPALQDRRVPPPVPRWGGKRAPEDMKAHLKFWARAVASNVRQEC